MLKIEKPTLLLNRKKCLANIRFMADKARLSGLTFRPHFKTHQSAVIGEWFRNEGVSAITVSSTGMAIYFADAGWKDITIAFPVNIPEIEKINNLASVINLNLLVVSGEVMQILSDRINHDAGIFIEIDTGYHRTGLTPDQTEQIGHIIQICEGSVHLRFRGFLVHAGNTYTAGNIGEIENICNDSFQVLRQLKERFETGTRKILLSWGDTPSCSVISEFPGIDEIRPGNFVFYDVMQLLIGSCIANQIAVALACPVVAEYQERNEVVIYGGAVHLTKESLVHPEYGVIYGLLVRLEDDGWSLPLPGCYLKSLTQEHGILRIAEPFFNEVKTGSLIGILPVHSCLTAAAMKSYLTTDGIGIPHFEGVTNHPLSPGGDGDRG